MFIFVFWNVFHFFERFFPFFPDILSTCIHPVGQFTDLRAFVRVDRLVTVDERKVGLWRHVRGPTIPATTDNIRAFITKSPTKQSASTDSG